MSNGPVLYVQAAPAPATARQQLREGVPARFAYSEESLTIMSTNFFAGSLRGISFCVLLMAGGCTTSRPLVITQPVGPIGAGPDRHAGRAGELVVYTSWDRFDPLDAEHRKHTAYKIRPEAGGPLLHVYNRRGSFRSEPEAVPLAGGRYFVEARATNVGWVEIPVIIREGETTVVYLDGVTAPSASQEQATNWVRQPSGLVVGWKDTASAK